MMHGKKSRNKWGDKNQIENAFDINKGSWKIFFFTEILIYRLYRLYFSNSNKIIIFFLLVRQQNTAQNIDKLIKFNMKNK